MIPHTYEHTSALGNSVSICHILFVFFFLERNWIDEAFAHGPKLLAPNSAWKEYNRKVQRNEDFELSVS